MDRVYFEEKPFPVTVRDNSPYPVPEGTSAVLPSPPDVDEETPFAGAKKDLRENPNV